MYIQDIDIREAEAINVGGQNVDEIDASLMLKQKARLGWAAQTYLEVRRWKPLFSACQLPLFILIYIMNNGSK